MPVYLLYGFQWPRAGFTGIRVYIVLHNLENATAEYLQQPLTSHLLLNSLKKGEGDIMAHLPNLEFIEQYDPDDTTSETAVSQPYAYVAARVIKVPDPNTPESNDGWNAGDLGEDSGLSPAASQALEELRNKLAPGARIGWWIVYNGDPERDYPQTDEESIEGGDYITDEEEDSGFERPKTASQSMSRFPGKLTRLFTRNSYNST